MFGLVTAHSPSTYELLPTLSSTCHTTEVLCESKGRLVMINRILASLVSRRQSNQMACPYHLFLCSSRVPPSGTRALRVRSGPPASASSGRAFRSFSERQARGWRLEGRTRQMSAERVVRDLAAARTDHVTFVDDNFLSNHRREDAIADLIKAEGLRKRFSMQCRTDSIVRDPDLVKKWVDIGLYAVLLDLEGSGATLETVNKNNRATVNDEAIRILHDLGVIIWGAFIIDPDWTTDDFHRLRDHVSTREITHTQFTVLTPPPGSALYQQRYDALLTHDYRCYDCLHAVLPTRLAREQFYQEFAKLYRQNDLGPYYDLVRQGKLTVEDCRRGKQMLDTMSQWERFVAGDPILGRDGLTSSVSPLARGDRSAEAPVR
ncbi:MAG: B12-binding domain-containing radical SAM protein [Planctomycetota bacterium]